MYARFTTDALTDPKFGSLEAWYRFDGDAMDSWRTHHGTIMGAGTGFAGGAVKSPVRRRGAGR